jgi:hypothetical protein
MQRRAAALYAVFFLVVGLVSFSLISTASAPQLAFENPDHELGEGDEFPVDGTTYTVDDISAEMKSSGGGGGHGGGGGGKHLVRSGTIVWTNESAIVTESWGADSEITYQNESWVVVVEGEDATSVTLREPINRTAILQNDSDVQNEVQTVDGTEYVVREESDGERTLIPADDYFPEPETLSVDQGETVQFDGNEWEVSAVGSDGATLSRVTPQEVEISVSDEANVTVGSQTYFAHFPNNNTLVLTSDYGQYQEFQHESDQFTEHKNGLWGVTIVTGLGAFFLIGLAYLPTRY